MSSYPEECFFPTDTGRNLALQGSMSFRDAVQRHARLLALPGASAGSLLLAPKPAIIIILLSRSSSSSSSNSLVVIIIIIIIIIIIVVVVIVGSR